MAGIVGVARGRSSRRGVHSARKAVQKTVTNTAAEVDTAAETSTQTMKAMSATPSGAATLEVPGLSQSIRRMWTSADLWHIHAVSGTVHSAFGAVYLLDVIAGDVAKLMGMTWTTHVPFELVLFSMVAGAVNAVSGLQPALLPRPFKDLLQLLGFGENGNLKSAGFVNTAAFYFFLTYQSVRPLPWYPSFLQAWDPVLALLSGFALFHAIFIMNSWVGRGKLSQGFALAISAPLLLNLPVSLHLLFEGQPWVEKLTSAYPGWPEVFFIANYCLAWAGSLVTLVLSLYERKVVDLTGRLLLTVLIGAICFVQIPLHAYLLIPEWFLQGQWDVMLTLTPH